MSRQDEEASAEAGSSQPLFPDFPLRRHYHIDKTDDELKRLAYESLSKQHDICVYPSVCKYFYIVAVEYGIRMQSWPERKHYRRLGYLHKGCRAGVRDSGNVILNCASKTTTTLDQWV